MSWTLDIGGVCLTLTGADEWVGALAQAWPSWAGESSGWAVQLLPDTGLPAPTQPYFEARPYFSKGNALLTAPGFVGEIAPAQRQAVLRAHPTARLNDISYFIRTVFALAAFEEECILCHAAGVLHNEFAYVLYGNSGSGKTTAAYLSQDKAVLNDDLLLLHPTPAGWEVWATPFGHRRHSALRSAPLRVLLRLRQASEDHLSPFAGGQALGELVANSPVINVDTTQLPALMQRWLLLLTEIPNYQLYFRKANTFWEVLDAHFK
ncbi:MAG: hypothetical protein U9Q70_00955 [Chloroflexota bacterium]|nr:hypothetical protein [Chloroflexota bacterium]